MVNAIDYTPDNMGVVRFLPFFCMKRPFDIPVMLKRIEKATAAYPKAAMFDLFDRGYSSLFEQLASCIISIRTLDETTIPLSEKLFAKARTPKDLMKLSATELETILYGSTFPGQKAHTLLRIAQTAVESYNGELPQDFASLTAIKGVGPKCAGLALGVAHGYAAISVDIHVHRVTNRWGLASAKTPEQTMVLLEQKIARERWTDINRLLMPFGKHICTGRMPRCSTCPVLEYCRQVGVTSHR
ncbi:MAG TPA: endonuclease III [Flavisolibacter sp.]|nr:endonuclease III [Flavisolibacter sp.]